MSKKILCMGAINIDLTMYASCIPKPGETVVTDNFSTFPGGKGGNQAATIGKLGGNVAFFTKMGNDSFSNQLKENLKDSGVDISPIIVNAGLTSGIAMIMVDANAQNSIMFTPGGNAYLSIDDICQYEDLFSEYDILEITLEINPDVAYEAIRIAHRHDMTVVLDPSPMPITGIPDRIASMIDYIKPNEIEAELLAGIQVKDEESARKSLDSLIKKGFKHPILTVGSRGLYTYNDGTLITLRPYPVTAIDTTAAGDIFLGAFTVSLAQEKTFLECLEYAIAAASLSVTKKGAQTSIPTKEEINVLLA
ncbi:ribokinase [Treponema sp. OMZ 840]|uniref:ribokinase n=1 Tax=Treponema sp. OMZ 840 TaxID=244313 RepID=UPI003D8A7A64